MNCRDKGVLGFFGVVEFDRSNEILSDSSRVSSSNPPSEECHEEKVIRKKNLLMIDRS